MMNKQQLGSFLFGMADILRDKVEDYKSYVLTLMFYKRLSDNYPWEEEQKLSDFKEEYGVELNEKQRAKILEEAHTFKIPKGCFWEDVRKAPLDEKNQKMDEAVKAIAEANPKLKGIINAVNWNEAAPDGSGRKRLEPRVLQDLINHLDGQNLSNKYVPLDVLGHAYEYLIKRFADENKGGTVAGQFYTPPEIVDLIVRYIAPTNGMTVYDPTCGSGGFLIKAGDYVKETQGEIKGLRLYGQETVWTTWAIARMNLMLHGLEGEIEQGDTIQNPKFLKDPGTVQDYDVVLANFPFSIENWAGNGESKKNKKGQVIKNKDGSPKMDYPDKGSYVDPFNRLIYGTPNFTNGDFAFIQHIIASLKPDGMAGVVCPNGVLFKGQPEKTMEEDGMNRKPDDDYLIRRGFIEGIGERNKNIIDAIVALPENLFYGNSIPGAIVFFNKNKPKEREDKILMVWGAKEGWFRTEPEQNILRPQDVMRILVQLLSYGDVDKAREIIPVEEQRLFEEIDDKMNFALIEIEEKYEDEETNLSEVEEELVIVKELMSLSDEERIFNLKDGTIFNAKVNKGNIEFLLEKDVRIPTNEKGIAELYYGTNLISLKIKNENTVKITKSDLNKLIRRKEKLEETLSQKKDEISNLEKESQLEKQAVQKVSQEMIDVFADPTQHRKYFALVGMDEIIENEFNLNLPRYIDTVEPEPEIKIEDAKTELEEALKEEKLVEEMLDELLNLLKIWR